MKKLSFVALIFACSFAYGQALSDTALQNSSGNFARVVPSAPVTVCQVTDNAVPCTQKIATFTDQTLGTPCTLTAGNGGPTSGTGCNNPGVADANGNYTIFAASGNYTICTYAQNYQCVKKTIGGIGGGASLPNAASTGQLPAATGPGTTYAAQTKAIKDVRDSGIDCTGATDSSTALNTLLSSINQTEVDLPYNCQIRADHQIVIQSQSAWVLKGKGDRPGVGGFGGPSIYGCNGSAGAVLYINRSGYGRIEGIGIYPKGPTGVCASSSFTQSVQIDSTGNPGVTTHDIILDHVSLTTSAAGTAIPSYIGLSVTDGGKQNGEMIRVSNSWIHCQNSSGSIGIYSTNNTSDNDTIDHNNITSCKYGIAQQGNMRIVGNLFTSNGINSVFGTFGASIYTITCSSGQMNILYNESDSGGPFLNNDNTGVNGCNSGFNIIGNMIGVSDIANGAYVIEVGATTNGTSWNIQGNTFLVTAATNQYIIGTASQAGNNGPLGFLSDQFNFYRTPTLSNTLGVNDQTHPFQSGEKHTFSMPGVIPGGPNSTTAASFAESSSLSKLWFSNQASSAFGQQSPYLGLRAYTGAANDDWLWQSAASGSASELIFNHNSGPASTLWFNWDGRINGLQVATLQNPAAPTGVTPTGTPGGTTYTYSIVAYGQSGSTAGSATTSTATGNASLSGSNYNLIQFGAGVGINRTCVYRTVGGATQGKIGCVNAVATDSNSQNAGVYFLKDTGLVADGTALPVINTTGKIITAVSTTGAAGLNLPHGTAPSTPQNGDLWTTTGGLFAQINNVTVGPFGTGGGGGGLSGQSVLGFPIAATATSSTSSTVPGTNQGTFVVARTNTSQGVAATPTESQVGDCIGQGSITGGATTYTIAYSDVPCNVAHDSAGAAAATITIPTPTTLHNPAPIFTYSNYSAFTDTLSPSAFSISQGSAAPGGTLSVPTGFACKVQLDSVNAATWKADCHQMTTASNTAVSVSGVGVSSPNFNNTTPAAGAGFQNGAWQVSGSNVSVEFPIPTTSTLWLPYGTINEPAITTASAQTGTVGANGVTCVQFTVPAGITFTKMTANVGTQSIGQTFNTGIYDSNLNLVRDSGSLSCAATGAVTTTVASTNLLTNTVYYHCTAMTDTTCAVSGVTALATGNAANKNATREFTCANALAAGALPATCGVQTTANQKKYMVLLEQ